MNQEAFEDLIMATYADLCIEWRLKVSSFHSNATEVNTKLTSLEEVIKAFGIGVPGLIDSKPPVEPAPEIPAPRKASTTISVSGRPSRWSPSQMKIRSKRPSVALSMELIL